MPFRRTILALYLTFCCAIYWLINMSLKTNTEITTSLTLWPQHLTLNNFITIFTDESWYSGYKIHSVTYVVLNTVISLALALPAAYAFSRYRFLGDKQPLLLASDQPHGAAGVFALPFFNLYSAIGLFDTPWAVALRTACSTCRCGVDPRRLHFRRAREIDETAQIDGYSFPHFFVKIFVPLIASRHRRGGVLLLSCSHGSSCCSPARSPRSMPSRSPRR